ncbi:aromatic-amino-acid transaminase [Palleronia aestuarii]|uniref:Aminotransferase n=1 Tax=Palleronia aestuarii TaxID=568105 RepID=A0A2W7NEM4_9RHOB|nr:amino acid aminotransferase [Palleronia aestuarii]PZX18881.1 aromatic-amino-acid transaminase [Palleronia aestuarii]
MFENLKPQPADSILSLMKAFRDDPRTEKLDLGVGVYRDADGRTPVMRAVKAAERRLWEEQDTKSYTALGGDPAFAAAMGDLILGEGLATDRRSAIATPGGTGAVRQAIEFIRTARPEARIWVPDPTWPNHLSILAATGRDVAHYRYFDAETGGVDDAGMIADLSAVAKGDVVLLHACCHNPTGADPDAETWKRIAETLGERGAVPLLDIAYQGFGDGLDTDAAGVRLLVQTLPELLICASCSKNFGLYRERVGLLLTIARDADTARMAQATLEHLNRQAYSFPPDHGARLVTIILGDPALRADWQDELESMRTRMLDLRRQLAAELRRETNSERFDAVADHRGMFTRLRLSEDEIATLRERHGVYMVGDGRINIAGLDTRTVPILARAIASLGD